MAVDPDLWAGPDSWLMREWNLVTRRYEAAERLMGALVTGDWDKERVEDAIVLGLLAVDIVSILPHGALLRLAGKGIRWSAWMLGKHWRWWAPEAAPRAVRVVVNPVMDRLERVLRAPRQRWHFRYRQARVRVQQYHMDDLLRWRRARQTVRVGADYWRWQGRWMLWHADWNFPQLPSRTEAPEPSEGPDELWVPRKRRYLT